MAIYIVHPGTGTILNAADQVKVVFFDAANGFDADDDAAVIDFANSVYGIDMLDVIDGYLENEGEN
jgi:hypothetical protein